jgi:hypothetical protein
MIYLNFKKGEMMLFGYIRRSKVLKIIDNGIEQLRNKETDVLLNTDVCKNEKDRLDFSEEINKLRGGIHFLECLKKHFN